MPDSLGVTFLKATLLSVSGFRRSVQDSGLPALSLERFVRTEICFVLCPHSSPFHLGGMGSFQVGRVKGPRSVQQKGRSPFRSEGLRH